MLRLAWISLRLAWIALRLACLRLAIGNGHGNAILVKDSAVCSLRSAVCKCHTPFFIRTSLEIGAQENVSVGLQYLAFAAMIDECVVCWSAPKEKHNNKAVNLLSRSMFCSARFLTGYFLRGISTVFFFVGLCLFYWFKDHKSVFSNLCLTHLKVWPPISGWWNRPSNDYKRRARQQCSQF